MPADQTTRLYSVHLDGYDAEPFRAASAAAARYAAYKAFRDGITRQISFRDFLARVLSVREVAGDA